MWNEYHLDDFRGIADLHSPKTTKSEGANGNDDITAFIKGDLALEPVPGPDDFAVYRAHPASRLSRLALSGDQQDRPHSCVSRKSVQRFCDNDTHKNKDLKRVAQKCAAVLR